MKKLLLLAALLIPGVAHAEIDPITVVAAAAAGGSGDAVLASSQTWSGVNLFSSSSTIFHDPTNDNYAVLPSTEAIVTDSDFGAFTSAQTTYTDSSNVAGSTITIQVPHANSRVRVWFSAVVEMSAGGNVIRFRLLDNGAVVGTGDLIAKTIGSGGIADGVFAETSFQPGAGEHSFSLQMKITGGTASFSSGANGEFGVRTIP